MRNIFLEKSYPNCGGETSPRPFSGKLNWAYLWIYSLKCYTVCFYRVTSWGLSKYTKTKLRTTCFHLILTFFETVSLPHFPYNFWKKVFLLLCSINWQNFIVWLPLLCEILDNMCIAIVCKTGCDVMNFEFILIFLIKPFFLHHQNVVTKTLISWRR